MERYAIGIIIRGTDTLVNLKNLFTTLKGIFDIQKVVDNEGKFTEHVYFKDDPNKEIKFFIGLAPNVSQAKKDKLFVNSDGVGSYYLPCMYSIEFRGWAYTDSQMEQRLLQEIGFQWKGYYVFIDTSTDLTDLSTRFIEY